MIYARACEKCNGDVELAQDIHGQYLICLQCSYTIDTAEATRRLNESKTKKAA